MKIAVEGCAHGELNKIYECIRSIELREHIKVDLLICCGDFQSVRDKCDMNSMAVPQKYMEMKDFCEYYTGKKVAPILTLFIGGNHEASNYLWELPYGGWVAENIYYLGYAGVVDFAGLRIGGASGIYKKHDYLKDHFEMPPFNNDSKRSFYHVRKRDIDKLKLMQSDPPDILLSHDWPMNIYNHGNKEQLIRFKPFLKDEIETGTLGNKGAEELLNHVKPAYWFSGHMHARFDALVDHPDGKKTKFLALDKCLPKRKFLQVIDMGEAKGEAVLKYDAFWVGILKLTNDLTRFQELNEEHVPNKEMVNELSCGDLDVLPFSKSINGENFQTTKFCERFNLKNPCKAQSWKSIKKTTKVTANLENQQQQEFPPRTPKLKMNLPKPGTGDTTVHKKLPVSQKKNSSGKIDNDDDEFGDISNPNSSNLVDSDHSDSDGSSGSSDSSSSSSAGSSEDEDEKVSSKNKIKQKNREMPSFIETPACAATPKYQTATPFGSTSTPFKWKAREEKMPIKALSFLDSSINSDRSSDEAKIKDRDSSTIDLTQDTSQNSDISVCNDTNMVSDNNVPKNIPSAVKQNEDKDSIQTPVKKFKLVRRNQSIYTPTKEDE